VGSRSTVRPGRSYRDPGALPGSRSTPEVKRRGLQPVLMFFEGGLWVSTPSMCRSREDSSYPGLGGRARSSNVKADNSWL